MAGIQTILHPTDFSDNSRPAFETACALARDYQAMLLVLHVMAPSVSPLAGSTPPDPLRSIEGQHLGVQLPWPRPSDSRIQCDHRLAEGDPVEEVLRMADRLPCDMIVMGTHGTTGLTRLLAGSVAEEVLRKASCPVLVVKTGIGPTPDKAPKATAGFGELVEAGPLSGSLSSAHTRTLFRSDAVEVVRLIVHAGAELPEHTSRGETTLQCLEGRVALTALGKTQILKGGNLLGLPAGEPHALKGIENASLLLTIVVPKK
jgi:nucleotide-binding universal stress UspA family protein/quercetin dioxygenase-like cupin family protein